MGSEVTSTQLVPQRVSPVVHPLVQPYEPPASTEQSGVVPPHIVPHTPQLVACVRSVSQPLLGLPSQSPKPAMHVVPQVLPSHVAFALVRVGHGVHEVVPQLVTEVFDTHAPLQLWKPLLHVKPHIVPSHVALALVGTGHGSHEDPHPAIESLATHCEPHAWKPVLHALPQCVPSQVAGPFVGAGQGVQLVPQLAAASFAAH